VNVGKVRSAPAANVSCQNVVHAGLEPSRNNGTHDDTTVTVNFLLVISSHLEIDFMRIGLRNVSHKAERCYTCRASLPKSPSPLAQSRVVFVPWEPNCIPTTQTRTTTQSAPYALATPRPSIASLSANDAVRMAAQRGIKGTSDPVIRTASPAPLAQDFARQQVSRQQRSNFHSTSLNPILANNMVTNTVNKTNLHPSGVA
jgi:hypothetical protein